jgi:hypothetical protein
VRSMTRSGRAAVAAEWWEGLRVVYCKLMSCCNAYTDHNPYLSYWTCILLKMVRSKKIWAVFMIYLITLSVLHIK